MAAMRGLPATDEVFLDSLRGEDVMGAVVRAHIHIEARVNRVLRALTPHPNHLPKNLRYEQAVRLAVAMGLHERILEPLKILGQIRNDFAHDLAATLTDRMANLLLESFSSDDREVIEGAYSMTNTQLATTDMPPLKDASTRNKFIFAAIAMDKFLIIAEADALSHRAAI